MDDSSGGGKSMEEGVSFTERLDIMIKGNRIRNNTITECSPWYMKITIIFSMLLVLEMWYMSWVRAEAELGLDLQGNQSYC